MDILISGNITDSIEIYAQKLCTELNAKIKNCWATYEIDNLPIQLGDNIEEMIILRVWKYDEVFEMLNNAELSRSHVIKLMQISTPPAKIFHKQVGVKKNV